MSDRLYPVTCQTKNPNTKETDLLPEVPHLVTLSNNSIVEVIAASPLEALRDLNLAGQFKIQVPSANGWADLKSCEDDGPYLLDLYKTKEEADKEAAELNSGENPLGARVVPADTPPEDELYE